MKENTIWVLECIFAPKESIFKNEIDFEKKFELNIQRLRMSVSFEVARQMGKGKRKGRIGMLYVTAKTYYISFRFLIRGKEVAQHGRIANFEGSKYLWEELKKDFGVLCSYEEFKEKYKPILRKLKHEFSEVAPYNNKYGDYKELNK